MANKQLKKGKLLGAQKGFVDTFNWLVRCMNNLQGTGGCQVNWPADDCPVVTADPYNNPYDPGGNSGMLGDADLNESDYEILDTPEDVYKSIQARTFNQGTPQEVNVLQLYNFNNTTAPQVTGEELDHYQFVVRDIASNCISYITLDSSSIGGGGSCTCELIPSVSAGTQIAEWTNDGENFVSIYAPSVKFSGTENTQTVEANAFTFQRATDSNVVISCNGNTITIGCYYL